MAGKVIGVVSKSDKLSLLWVKDFYKDIGSEEQLYAIELGYVER